MTPLPPPLGSRDLLAWRLDTATFAGTWDSGEGAYRVGGRWNSKGRRAVYCALDPSTAILEVAVHKGFKTLDTVSHVLTSLQILDPVLVHVVGRAEVPNPNWLVPGIPSAGQQAFGDQLLTDHLFIAIPSTVSKHSWNLVFDAQRAAGASFRARHAAASSAFVTVWRRDQSQQFSIQNHLKMRRCLQRKDSRF